MLRQTNVEIMMGSDTNDIGKELLESGIQKNQELMKYLTKNSGLILEGVELMNYDVNKISINRSGSYIESLMCLKFKKCKSIHKIKMITIVFNMLLLLL